MIIVDRISQLPNGQPVDAGTPVELRRELDGTLLDTQLTDIDGWVQFQSNGSPGPVYTQVTIGSETRYRYGRAVAQVGSWFEGEWQSFMDLVVPGVVMTRNPNALEVVPGSGLQVQVSPGSAMADGILGRYYVPENIPVPSNGSGNPRLDLVVMRLYTGGNQVGRVLIDLVQGTPAASPVEPAITPLPNVAQIVLGRVRVQSGVSIIQTSDIVDRREAASFVPDGSVTPDKLDRIYSEPGHDHDWSEVTGKPTSYPPASHTHAWGEVTGKPTTFAPSAHNHSATNVNSGTLHIDRIPTIPESKLASSVQSKLNQPVTGMSNLFPANKTTLGGASRLMRTAPGNEHNAIMLVGSGVAYHDVGDRRTTDEGWGYVYLPGAGFGWLPTAKMQ